MRKLPVILLFLPHVATGAVCAESDNPFFGGCNNQVSVGLGIGTDSSWLFADISKTVPFAEINMQYGQPGYFFRLPARKQVQAVILKGWGKSNNGVREWNWSEYGAPMIFLSEDVAPWRFGKIYAGFGLGIGMQARQNERIGTKLLFGLKLLAGYEISADWRLELFMQHFSNGSTDPANDSYNFIGFGFARNF